MRVQNFRTPGLKYKLGYKSKIVEIKNNIITFESRTDLLYYEKEQFEALFNIYQGCQKCPQKQYLTLEHLIPKDILEQMGIDTKREAGQDNYQILCNSCNNFKSNKLDFANPLTKILLTRYLKRVPDEGYSEVKYRGRRKEETSKKGRTEDSNTDKGMVQKDESNMSKDIVDGNIRLQKQVIHTESEQRNSRPIDLTPIKDIFPGSEEVKGNSVSSTAGND